jgi:hypothetical protein
MSQTGTITSCGGNATEYGSLNWVVDFSYQLDAGGVSQSRVLVGNNPNLPGFTVPTSPLWASPTSTITVTPNPPGTTNPVTLTCPPQVLAAAFGLS